MSYPDLPGSTKAMLADERVRTHHHLWHFVRSRSSWESLPAQDRARLQADGWKAPRFEEDAGSGLDFLGMHRHMIHMVNAALASAADPDWPAVIGWSPIPWSDTDPDWPVPAWQTTPPAWATAAQWAAFTEIAERARTPQRVQAMQQIAGRLNDPVRLRQMTLDELGSAMEWSIHGWMHIRWSGAPHPEGFSSEPSNDWLFVPWSSHVNKHFWKLHGWIDERIGVWEAATGEQADLSGAWSGPPGVVHHDGHMADPQLLSVLPPRETVPLPMRVREHIVEGLLR